MGIGIEIEHDRVHAPQIGLFHNELRRRVQFELNPSWWFTCDECGYHLKSGPDNDPPPWCPACQNDVKIERRPREPRHAGKTRA